MRLSLASCAGDLASTIEATGFSPWAGLARFGLGFLAVTIRLLNSGMAQRIWAVAMCSARSSYPHRIRLHPLHQSCGRRTASAEGAIPLWQGIWCVGDQANRGHGPAAKTRQPSPRLKRQPTTDMRLGCPSA